MNSSQVAHIVRFGLTFLGAWMTGRGMSAETWAAISTQLEIILGALFTLGPLIWGYLVHTDKAKVTQVAEMPNVYLVQVRDPELAALPNPKIVAAPTMKEK